MNGTDVALELEMLQDRQIHILLPAFEIHLNGFIWLTVIRLLDGDLNRDSLSPFRSLPLLREWIQRCLIFHGVHRHNGGLPIF